MRRKFEIRYIDRQDGMLKTEHVYADRFLFWSYNNPTGRLAMDLIFRRKFISQLYGWLHKRRWSRWKIKSFVKKFDVNLDELVCRLDDFTSFNDFFIREIDLIKRKIITDPDICIAPVDGKVLAYPYVEPDLSFQIKRNTFNLHSFLGNNVLARKFAYGSMVVCRLCLTDYHHFHFPDSGIPHQALSIPGKYHAGSPCLSRKPVPYYAENHRMLTLFDSDHFGPMVMSEIGALTVGSIRQSFNAGMSVSRGDLKGIFELGGSTVVLLFQKDAIELDKDLCENTINGIETYIRLGDSIGKRMNSSAYSHEK